MRIKKKGVVDLSSKIQQTTTPDPFTICEVYAPITFEEYCRLMPHMSNSKVRATYKHVFNKECTVPITWAKYQISYELARQSDIKNGNLHRLLKGSEFRSAYEGTMKCDIEHTGETLKTLIQYELKVENSQENIMKIENKAKAVKKAVEAKKANRVGVTLGKSVPETWVHVFSTNDKNKWTDEKISQFMHAEFPDLKNKAFDTVHGCRVHYNNGGYTKGVKPASKSVRYLEDGTEWKKGTKAKKETKSEPVLKAKRLSAKRPVAKLKVKKD